MNPTPTDNPSAQAPALALEAPIVLTPDQLLAIAGGVKASPISSILSGTRTRMGFVPIPLPKLPKSILSL